MSPWGHTGEQVVPLLPLVLRHDSHGSSLLRRHSCTLELFLGHFPTFSNVSAHHVSVERPLVLPSTWICGSQARRELIPEA